MGGGILQLVARGATDVNLTGNPQVTFFKSVYKRYTNFAMEEVLQSFNGDLSADEFKIETKLNHNGDLLRKIWLEIDLPESPTNDGNADFCNWSNGTGYAYIKEASLKIGTQTIDTQYSEWLDVWNEFTDVYRNETILVNKNQTTTAVLLGATGKKVKKLKMFVPLQFWFCKNTGAALPLISLQYIDVKLSITFRSLNSIINSGRKNVVTGIGNIGNQTTVPDVKLYCEYIYIDKDERRKFATSKHEYLIEQVQKIGPIPASKIIDLDFNHSIKEIIWVFRDKNRGEKNVSDSTNNTNITKNKNGKVSIAGNDYFNYNSNHERYSDNIRTNITHEPFDNATILFNNQERFPKRPATYFRMVQPLNFHSRVPDKNVYVYSFSFNPEYYQPTGCCNFTKLDAKLKFDDADNMFDKSNTGNMISGDSSSGIIKDNIMDIIIFATNYNLYKISNGVGALAYTNTRV